MCRILSHLPTLTLGLRFNAPFLSANSQFETTSSLLIQRILLEHGRILWVDCLGGLAVGVLVLVFADLLSQLQGLPFKVLFGMGVANLTYGSFSLWVTTRRNRSRSAILVLAIANMCWLVMCLGIVIFSWGQITPFGTLHVCGEGIYVASLGLFEWRNVDRLIHH